MSYKFVGITGLCRDQKIFNGQNWIYKKILNYIRFTLLNVIGKKKEKILLDLFRKIENEIYLEK